MWLFYVSSTNVSTSEKYLTHNFLCINNKYLSFVFFIFVMTNICHVFIIEKYLSHFFYIFIGDKYLSRTLYVLITNIFNVFFSFY